MIERRAADDSGATVDGAWAETRNKGRGTGDGGRVTKGPKDKGTREQGLNQGGGVRGFRDSAWSAAALCRFRWMSKSSPLRLSESDLVAVAGCPYFAAGFEEPDESLGVVGPDETAQADLRDR